MGGHGSGRRGGRPTMEKTDSILIRVSAVIPARGRPPPPSTRFSGSRGGIPFYLAVAVTLDCPDVGRGFLQVLHESILHPGGSETGPQDYIIKLVAAPCTLGGRRWLFVCPRTKRFCRALVLPNGGRQLLSRQGYQLGYRSQRIKGVDACNARLTRVYRKLGAVYDRPGSAPPRRPKGMRRRAYEKLLDDVAVAERLLDTEFIAGAKRLLGRLRD